ncbi:MarR family transcriptional regulator [bacterium]|nr:MarR family transcriptional regulator [bacterium]
MKTKSSSPVRKTKKELVEEIVERLARRHGIAIVLLHHAVAEHLGIGPTDQKCLDLLREHGAMTGSDLAAITGLTTGAITGVVSRLEKVGFVRREAHSHDRRKQVLKPAADRIGDIHSVFEPIRNEAVAMLEHFDVRQLSAIAEFLATMTEIAHRHMALFGSHTLHGMHGLAGLHHTPSSEGKCRK